MMRTKIFLLSILIATVSLTFALQFAAPRRTANVSLIESTLINDKVALLEPLTLTLDLPSVIRLGDIGVFRMTITIDAHGDVAVATNESDAMPIANGSDAFDSYNVVAEARLDLPRLYVVPSNMVSQPVRAGQSITFTWSVRADAVGEYEGTAWFFLRFVPKGENINLPEQVTGPGSELAVAAIPFDMQVVSLFEMKGSTARILGTTGLFVCILIALPLLLDRFYRKERHPSL